MFLSDVFWNASLAELKKGYIEAKDDYICLLCGKNLEKGVIYKDDETFYEAGRYMGIHIEKEHGSVFNHLIQLDKKLTGLTDHQNSLLQLFYQSKTDAEVQQELGIGSASTIRNHRFALKEKERQAKVFLTLMELLKEKDAHGPAFLEPYKTSRIADDRYNVTQEEMEKIIKKYLPQGFDGPLKTFEIKEKYKLVVLGEIAKVFRRGKTYSEKEVNQILEPIYDDYVRLRRALIDYGFLDREEDGSQYWLNQSSPKIKNDIDRSEMVMDRKKELIREYKEQKVEAGVYQIRNTINQRIFIDSTPNLKTLNGKQMQLNMGQHMNRELQKELKEFGKDAFVIEVLEVLKKKEDSHFDLMDALKKLEEKWIEALKPFGDKGYH